MEHHLIRPIGADYTEYLRDESRTQGRAESISFPRSEAELAAVLRGQYKAGRRITVQGARTGLAAAAVPDGGHVLNLTRMDAVLGMRAEGGRFVLRVQPGVILSRLRDMVEEKRFAASGWDEASKAAFAAFRDAAPQFFPTDPTEASATVGGMTACNASGAKSYLYGPMRRHVAGLKAVLCDGDTLTLRRGGARSVGRRLTLATDGGRTLDLALPAYRMPSTKNASGYYIADDMDAVDLFIGSDGTLAVLSEIELYLSPRPPEVWGAICFFGGEARALDFVVSVRETVERVAAIEYFDEHSLDILRGQKRGNAAFAQLPEIPARYRCAVYIELHCESEEQAAARLFEAGALAQEEDSWVANTAADLDKLYFFRHAVPESVNMLLDARRKAEPAIAKLGTDMAVPDAHLRAVMAMYRRDLAARGLEYAIWGHIGDNHLHVNILPRSASEMETGRALYKKWAAAVSALGGSVSAEHGVGKLKAAFLTVMYGERQVAEMAALKRQLDPKWLLGTGNLFEKGAAV